MMKIKSKKGSHVAVIISFAIFVTFLFFIYIALEPAVKSKQAREEFLDSSKNALMSNFSADIITASINIDDADDVEGEDCIKISEISSIIPPGLDGNNIFVRDSTGAIDFSWDEESSTLSVEVRNDNQFFKAYASEGISSTETSLNGCPTISSNRHTIGLVKTEEKIFAKRILNAMQAYQADYSGFKTSLNISDDKNIGFDFTYSNGTTISTGEESPNTNVYALEFPIDYLGEDMFEDAGKLTVRTW